MRSSLSAALAATLIALAGLAAAQTRELPDFTQIVEQQGGAVVNISTTQQRQRRAQPQIPQLDEDDPMFEFFRRFIPRGPQGPREFESSSLGSGFVVSQDGYILTNAHVVDSADEITVKFNDKREFKAKVIGADRRTDVALIKIDAAGLQAVKFGDPSKLRVGEWVVAIGAPFGFENSVTAGIVSAKGRSLPQENFVPFIQTDVAINPGNSGGPLFNLRGEVVGINSQIYSRTGGFMGLSFAIPIDVAMEISGQLRSAGRVQRGRIGVVIQEVSKELADSFGLGKPAGALVNGVEKGGPAEKAGVETGDIILRFDGKPIDKASDLPRMVGSTRPGSKVAIQVWRKGSLRDLQVTVAEMEPERSARTRGQQGGEPAPSAKGNPLGLAVTDLSEERRAQLGIRHGVLVEVAEGAAARAGLRQGDILLSLDNQDLTSARRFLELSGKLDAKRTHVVLVRRGDSAAFVPIKPGE